MEMMLMVVVLLLVILIGFLLARYLDRSLKDGFRRSLFRNRKSKVIRIGVEREELKQAVQDAKEYCQYKDESIGVVFHCSGREKLLNQLRRGRMDMVLLQDELQDKDSESLMVMNLENEVHLLWNAYESNAGRDRFLFVLKNHFTVSKQAYRDI